VNVHLQADADTIASIGRFPPGRMHFKRLGNSLLSINRAMNYLCGKDCPSYPRCTNGSLFLRPQKATKVVFTGARGFGLNVLEDVDEGDFIMDYRGEIIGLE